MNALATNSKSLQPLGIETIYPHNSMTYQEAELEITHSRDAFLLTRYFDAFNNAAVRNAISRLLQDGGACRLILYAPKGSHLGSLQGTDTGGTYLSTKIGHTLGNMHRPIKISGEKIYFPIQADSEIELLNKMFQPIRDHLSITKAKMVFEPEEGIHVHEHG